MRKTTIVILWAVLALALGACAQSGGKPIQAQVVEQHLNALVERDEARFTLSICEAWTVDAFIEYDSLGLVQPKLEGLSCSVLNESGEQATVQCSGEIVATYGSEVQRFPLDGRAYNLVLQSGEWLVCGYTQ